MNPDKCFVCDQKHWREDPCPEKPTVKIELEAYPHTVINCPTCGTNLLAKKKAKKRRREWTRKDREKKRGTS